MFVAYFIVIFFNDKNKRVSFIPLLSSCFLTAVIITGNEKKMHHLLSQGTYELRMDIEDFDNQTHYVKYTRFNLEDESKRYIVTISGFSGNVDQSLVLFSISCFLLTIFFV